MKKKIIILLFLGIFLTLPVLSVHAITIGPSTPYSEVLQVNYMGSVILDFDFIGFGSDTLDVMIGAYGLGPFMEPTFYPMDQRDGEQFPVASFVDEFIVYGRINIPGMDFIPISRTDFQATIPLSTEYSYQLKIEHVGRAFDAPAISRELQQSMASLQLDVAGQTAPIPEPATMLLLGTGLVGIAGIRRKMKK